MNIKIIRTGLFELMLRRLVERHASIKTLTKDQIKLFQKNPNDTRLGVHPLRKRMKGKWAIEVDKDIRIVFVWQGERVTRFLAIGRHDEVYGSKRRTKRS